MSGFGAMPEGHTIHRMARDHRRWLRGEAVRADSPQGRASELAAAIEGRRLVGTDAYGKHLLHRWEGDLTVHVHLGLFGRFFRRKLPAPPPTPGTRLQLCTGTHVLRLSGPTACRRIDPDEEEALVARLGPDPLRSDADPERALAALGRRRIPIAAAIMDQRVIAGIGNVYRAEALNVLGIHPHLPSRELPERRGLLGALDDARIDARRRRPGAAHRDPAGGGREAPAEGSAGDLGLPAGALRPLRHRCDQGGAGRAEPVLVPGLPAAG